ncbi:MAG: AMP-binding protein [Gammaproteobacteria bacterium]|nr:AMP-binding protein [Gammaproteobacteria bacterium]
MADTVWRAFLETAHRHPARPFLHVPRQATAAWGGEAVDFTYDEARRRIETLAATYRAAGYGSGHRVALVLENRADFFLHFLALNSLGAGIVPVNAAFPAPEMAYVIRHSDAGLVVTLPEHRDRVLAALGQGGAPAVIDCDAPHLLPMAAIAAGAPPGLSTEVALLYTSGTTGRPKGCMLSNAYFLGVGKWYLGMGGYCALRPGEERLITPLPLVHMNALASSLLAMVMSGGCLIQLDRFHASTWWETVRESRATCLHYLGVMPAILLGLPESPADDCSGQIRFGFGAGSDPRHRERFEKRFGFPLIEGWAMTETGTEVCICAQHEPRHVGTRCIGRPTGPIEYRLIDESGRDVAPGEPGELLIRAAGPDPRRGFFSGYYKDPEATAQAWEGGYFHTGDVMRVDAEGLFYFVDRRKNIIRRSGENIAAVEVEGILYQHPAVAACAVAPVPDEVRGEEVAALVVLKPGSRKGPEAADSMFRYCADRMIYYKAPGYLIYVDELPMTASQKIQRGEVKGLAQRCVASGACFDFRELKRKR